MKETTPTMIASTPTVSVDSLPSSFQPNIGPQISIGEGFNFNPSFGTEIKPISIESSFIGPDLNFPSLSENNPSIFLDRTVPVPEIVFNKNLFYIQARPLNYKGLTEIEEKADEEAQNRALSLTENIFLDSPEEQNFWIEKIKNIRTEETEFNPQLLDLKPVFENTTDLEANSKLSPNLETKDQAQQILESQAETDQQPQTILEAETLQRPETEIETEDNLELIVETFEEKPKIPVLQELEEDEWLEYQTEEKRVISTESIAKRKGVAKSILNSLQGSKKPDIASEVSSQAHRLDSPDFKDTTKIASGELEYPNISTAVTISMAFLKEKQDPKQISTALDHAIDSAPPLEKVIKIKSQTRKKTSQLEDEPKELAAKGATKIAMLKKFIWMPIEKLRLKNPVELEKIEDKSKQNILRWAQEGSNL